jgi:geranylgeranyl diphosphate synthase type I
MSYDILKSKIVELNSLVGPIINELLAEDVESSNTELMLYQCQSGGKRLRPAMLILSGQAFGCDINDLVYPAASIEILHNTTLIIDDIIDHSEFRRDKPTCWNKFGKSVAECASLDYSFSVFSGLNRASNSRRLIDLYSKTLKTIVDGEIKDILFESSGRDDEAFVAQNRYKNITKDDYLEMIRQKTAVLLQTCCKAGAICANASDQQIEIIGNFGLNLGMAFQIRDDILDIFGDEKEFGKKIGKDIIEKKLGNIVILLAVEQLEQPDRDIIFNILNSASEISNNDVAMVTTLINKTTAKTVVESIADSYIQSAFEQLNLLPQNEYTATLAELANYIVSRDN